MIASQLVAHRGWQNRYPENSFIAIQKALQAGAQHIEIDVQLSSDGHLVLCHDRDLKRLTGQVGLVDKMTWQQLQQRSFYEPERLGEAFLSNPICSLDQCIALIAQHPTATLYVEIKRSSLKAFSRERVLDTLLPKLADIAGQAIIISFDYQVLRLAQRHYGYSRIGPVARQWQDCVDGSFDDLAAEVIFCDAEIVPDNVDLSLFNSGFVIYEIADIDGVYHWLARGAQLVETFCIGELISQQATR